MQPGSPSALDATLREQHVGGVVLLGGWTGATAVTATSTHLQQVGAPAAGGLGLLVAADQEGGQVQQLKGAGFTTLPPALVAGRTPGTLAATAERTAGELRAAGVNVNLAPVADTVTAAFAPSNGPIGRFQREYANDPSAVAVAVTNVVTGLQSGGASATIKHFPGLGRVAGNTDVTAIGITDSTAAAGDPNLAPFAAGIRAGARLVMVSSARYPGLDPDNPAVFSAPIVTGLLRGTMGYAGVVVTDDVGAAKAVAAVPVAERATRFIAAGGDIVLTAVASQVPTMAAAVTARAASDPAFAAQVDAAVHRVVALKQTTGLAGCG